jgi:hypothetical protein
VAPTGIAALNAGGVTIHSMFQLPFGGLFQPLVLIPNYDTVKFESKDTLRRHFKMSGLKKSVIRNMELLVIDEVYAPDLLDAMDYMMQTVRKNTNPLVEFRCCLLVIAIPPVIRDEEWRTLRNLLQRNFPFMPYSKVRHYTLSYLIYRQTDTEFISVE